SGVPAWKLLLRSGFIDSRSFCKGDAKNGRRSSVRSGNAKSIPRAGYSHHLDDLRPELRWRYRIDHRRDAAESGGRRIGRDTGASQSACAQPGDLLLKWATIS